MIESFCIRFDEIIEKVCYNCKYYIRPLGVCSDEVLPVEAAILRNAAGRGLCDDVKDFVIAKGGKEDKNECKTES